MGEVDAGKALRAAVLACIAAGELSTSAFTEAVAATMVRS